MSFLSFNWFSFLNRKLKIQFFVVVICLLSSAIIGSSIPILIQKVFDSFSQKDLFFQAIGSLLFIYIGDYINRTVYRFSMNLFIRDLIIKVRELCYRRWIPEYEFHEDFSEKKDIPMGEVIARIIGDTEAVRELVSSGTLGVFIDVFFIVSCLVSFVVVDLKIGLSLIFVEVFFLVMLLYFGRYMTKIFYSLRSINGVMSRKVADFTQGLSDLFYLQNSLYIKKEGEIVFGSFLKKQVWANVWDAGYYSLAESLFPLLLIFFIFLASYLGISQIALVGVFIDLVQRSIGPIKDITGKLSNIQRALAGLKRIKGFLENYPVHIHQDVMTSRYDFEDLSLSVEIDNFSYHSKKEFCLQNIRFQGKSGQMIGVIGPSGSGKSTLLKILTGKLPLKSGKIEIFEKGENFLTYHYGNHSWENYKHFLSLITQDAHIFSETLRFNLCLKLEVSSGEEEKLRHFWANMQGLEYLRELKIDLDTLIRPNELSLGQKQLITALRALYLKRPIVLFDEISSGLDSLLEFSLRKVVSEIQKSGIVFYVAHRLETVLEADKILFLENGQLVSAGTHEEQLENCERYRKFVDESHRSA